MHNLAPPFRAAGAGLKTRCYTPQLCFAVACPKGIKIVRPSTDGLISWKIPRHCRDGPRSSTVEEFEAGTGPLIRPSIDGSTFPLGEVVKRFAGDPPLASGNHQPLPGGEVDGQGPAGEGSLRGGRTAADGHAYASLYVGPPRWGISPTPGTWGMGARGRKFAVRLGFSPFPARLCGGGLCPAKFAMETIISRLRRRRDRQGGRIG